MIRFAFFISIILILFSCNSEKKKIENYSGKYERGIIIDKINCISDTTQCYAMYLPSYYVEDNTFPIIFCFDAHAGGVNAVEHFKNAAEKFGYVIVASNNSKNNAENAEYIIQTFMTDVEANINFDKNRKYTAGFSGGARIAAYLAIENSDIKGVASLSAGFPELNGAILNHKFCFYGLFGNEDFNMYESITSETLLETLNLNYHIEIFDGEHEWAPSENIENALIFFELNAMRNDLKKKDKEFINKTVEEFDSILNLKTSSKYLQFQTSQKAIHFLNNLTDIEYYSNFLTEVNSDKSFQTEVDKIQKIKELEIQLQQQYYQCFDIKDTTWWKNEIQVFNKKIENESDLEYKHFYNRLLNYTGMISFILTNNALTNNNLVNSEKYLKIYELVDSKNVDMMYFYGCFYSLKNDKTNAIKYLKIALENGFTDIEKMKSDKMLENISSEKEFIQLIERK